MIKKIDRFDREYFKKLKTQEERDKYFVNYILKTSAIMEKGGTPHDN